MRATSPGRESAATGATASGPGAESSPDATVLQRACAEAPSRQVVDLTGTVSAVVLRPRRGVPALEAVLEDGTGSVNLVWLGRRHLAGLEPGRTVSVHGLVCEPEGIPTIFNPRYELRARSGE